MISSISLTFSFSEKISITESNFKDGINLLILGYKVYLLLNFLLSLDCFLAPKFLICSKSRTSEYFTSFPDMNKVSRIFTLSLYVK